MDTDAASPPEPPGLLGRALGRPFQQPLVLLAALAMVCSFLAAWRTAREAASIDFYHFWTVTRAVEAGQVANPYSPAGRHDLFLRMARKGEFPQAPPTGPPPPPSPTSTASPPPSARSTAATSRPRPTPPPSSSPS